MFRRTKRGQRGFSLGELLAVLAIAGIVVTIGVPLVSEQLRQAKIRSAADQYAMSLKAARMIAVSKRSPVSILIITHPTNSYQYTDAAGRVRQVVLPTGVRITSSDTPITFQLNGSLATGTTTVMETDLISDIVERFTVTTNTLGAPTVAHERL